jgi:hypothetical protein
MTQQNQIPYIEYDCSKVYIAKSYIHGRGVLARENIDSQTTIETFPIFPLQFRTNYHFDQTILNYSLVNDSCKCGECQKHGYVIYLPMGYGGLYNYAVPKELYNAFLDINFEHFYAKIIAYKNIQKDEEITLNIEDSYVYKQLEKSKNENK